MHITKTLKHFLDRKTILKNRYVFHISLLVILIVLDQFSKYLALQYLSFSEGSFLGFSLNVIENYSFIFGFLNIGSGNIVFSTVITAIFCLFLFYYIISLIFIPRYFYYLQIGVTVLFAGFAGNALNKIINGYVIDFLRWSPYRTLNIHFNLADIFQTVAWLFILSQILVFRKHIWRENEKRKQLIIIKSYQLQFIGYSVLGFICLSVFFLLLNYQFLEFIKIESFTNINQIDASFLKYSLFMLFLFCLLIAFFFLYLSNKIYGPLYAFQRYIEALLNGEKPEDLKVRKDDQLKHLEDLARDIKKSLEKSN